MIRLVAATARQAVGGDPRRQFDRRGQGLPRLGQTVDQTQLVGPLGGQRVAGQGQLHGDLVGNAPRQAQQTAAGGDQATFDLGDAERGFSAATIGSVARASSVPPASA